MNEKKVSKLLGRLVAPHNDEGAKSDPARNDDNVIDAVMISVAVGGGEKLIDAAGDIEAALAHGHLRLETTVEPTQ